MTDFGTDIATIGGLGKKFRLVDGLTNYAQAIVRRLSTPRGGLFYAPDYGYDVREFLNETDSAEARFSLEVNAAAECEKDPRTLSADAELTEVGDGDFRLRLALETTEGPVALVLNVERLTVEVLNADLG